MLDEPVDGPRPRDAAAVWSLIWRMWRREGMTVAFVSSHNLRASWRTCATTSASCSAAAACWKERFGIAETTTKVLLAPAGRHGAAGGGLTFSHRLDRQAADAHTARQGRGQSRVARKAAPAVHGFRAADAGGNIHLRAGRCGRCRPKERSLIRRYTNGLSLPLLDHRRGLCRSALLSYAHVRAVFQFRVYGNERVCELQHPQQPDAPEISPRRPRRW